MLPEGETAPDFRLLGTDGADIDSYRLQDYAAEGAVVLRFYPGDFSAVCGDKLCEFRDAEWLTVNPDVTVFGISTDTLPAHRAFVDDLSLNFPLLSDNRGEVTGAYDVVVDELAGHPVGAALHAMYVVDADREIRFAWALDLPSIPDLETLRQVDLAKAGIAIQPDFGDVWAVLDDIVGLPEAAPY